MDTVSHPQISAIVAVTSKILASNMRNLTQQNG